MNKVKGVFVLAILFFVSCNAKDKTKYVLGEKVQIEFYDTLGTSDWISIDNFKFEHIVEYEGLMEDSLADGRIYAYDILPTTIQDLNFKGAEDKIFKSTQGDAQQAHELFKHLALKSDEDGNQIYKFSGNSLDIATGKLLILRHDGAKIKVSTSEGYGAAISKIKDK